LQARRRGNLRWVNSIQNTKPARSSYGIATGKAQGLKHG